MFNDSLFDDVNELETQTAATQSITVIEQEIPSHIVELPVSYQVVCKNSQGKTEPVNTYFFKDNNKAASTAMSKAKSLQIIAKNSTSPSLKNNTYHVVCKLQHVNTITNKVEQTITETYFPKM